MFEVCVYPRAVGFSLCCFCGCDLNSSCIGIICLIQVDHQTFVMSFLWLSMQPAESDKLRHIVYAPK